MIKTLKHAPHELAKLFPPMESEQLRELAEDIKKNGLLELIILLDGKVLDGVHRQKACTMAGVEPRYVPWEELNDSATASGPLNFVMSRNLKRRHLTASQRAAVATDALPFFEAEAKKRQGRRTDLQTTSPPKGGEVQSAAAAAAKTTGASTRQVERAKRLQKESPAKFEQVKAGKLTLTKAERDKAKTEAAKKSRADAIARVAKVCSKGLADAVERGSLLKGKQLSQFVALPDEKMKDVENLIVVGWPLKKALLFKEKKLTRKHKIEDLLDAAAKAGMKLQVEIDRWAVKVWRVPKGEGI